jgi:hypothetical protein
MSFLSATWDSERSQIVRNQHCLQQLRDIPVLCRFGLLCELQDTYLPAAQVEAVASRFLNDEDSFPWLELESPVDDSTFWFKWERISRDLGLAKTDLDFTISLLECLSKSPPSASDDSLSERAYALYCFLEAKIRESSNIDEAREQVR